MEKQPEKSIRVPAGTRVYFLDVLRDSREEPYVMLSEVPTARDTARKRTRIFIHKERLTEMVKAFREIVGYIEGEYGGKESVNKS